MTLHIDMPTTQDVERLLSTRRPGCVSIYLPTSPITQEAEGARIQLKDLSATAHAQLVEAGMDKRELTDLADVLDDLVEDEHFWTRQANSLAVFATPDGARTFRVPNRLTTIVEVSDRFHVKPLLRMLTFADSAFVLALSQNAVRLIEFAPETAPSVVTVPGMPTDAASSVGKASISDRSPDRGIQGSEGKNVRLHQYARRVEEALRPVLAGRDRPLILASTPPLDSIFRAVSTYPHLAAHEIRGNPDRTTDAELTEESRRVLDEIHAAELAELRARYEQRVAQGRASDDVAAIARAATFGAVDTAFVDFDETIPGFVDEETGAVTIDDADDAVNYGVIDEIARRVLLARGRVLAVRRADIPGEGPVAAILRFPV